MIDKTSRSIYGLSVNRVAEVSGEREFLTVEITDKMASRNVRDGLPCVFGWFISVPSYEIKVRPTFGIVVFSRPIHAVGDNLMDGESLRAVLNVVFAIFGAVLGVFRRFFVGNDVLQPVYDQFFEASRFLLDCRLVRGVLREIGVNLQVCGIFCGYEHFCGSQSPDFGEILGLRDGVVVNYLFHGH